MPSGTHLVVIANYHVLKIRHRGGDIPLATGVGS